MYVINTKGFQLRDKIEIANNYYYQKFLMFIYILKMK